MAQFTSLDEALTEITRLEKPFAMNKIGLVESGRMVRAVGPGDRNTTNA